MPGFSDAESMTEHPEIDQEMLHAIVERLETEFDRIGRDYGVYLQLRGGSFHAHNARFDLEIASILEDGLIMTRDAETFMARAEEFDLEPEDLGRLVRFEDGVYRIMGLRPRAKRCVECVRIEPPDGHLQRASPDEIRAAWVPKKEAAKMMERLAAALPEPSSDGSSDVQPGLDEFEALATAFVLGAPDVGLEADDLGKSFVLDGTRLRILGADPGAPEDIACLPLGPRAPDREADIVLVPAEIVRRGLRASQDEEEFSQET